MKATTLKKLKDGAKFKLSNRASGAIYKLVIKSKGKATVTSTSSERSFIKDQSTVVYPV
jgi:hypothetical protein